MANDDQAQPPDQQEKRFWHCFIVEGVLKFGCIVSVANLLSNYYLIPWFTERVLHDFEYEYKWIIGSFVWQALFAGFIFGLFVYLRRESKRGEKN